MREFTKYELGLRDLLSQFCAVLQSRGLSTTLVFSNPQAVLELTENGMNPISCQYNKSDDTFIVTMSKNTYIKYLDFCCKKVGIKVDVFGDARTYDNYPLLVINDEW